MKKRSALLFGSTGMVGKEVLKLLIDNPLYEHIIIFTRKKLEVVHPKLTQKVIRFEQLSDYQSDFQVDDVYVCLGTTIKKAKSKEAFKKVDLTFPIEIAKQSKKAGVKQYLIVTAIGSDPNSKVFYNQIKGQVEQELKALQIPSTHIFRPSLLLGEREEFRFGEKIAEYLSKPFSFLFMGPIKKYRPIRAENVAKAMIYTAQKEYHGYHIYESDQIVELSNM